MNEEMTFRAMGEEGIARMVAAFYRRMREDDLIGPMYPADDWEGSEERLRDFLLFRIGGNPRYMETRGHPRLRMRHIHFQIGEKERDRWIELMEAAMDEAEVPEIARLWLSPFLRQVADFLRNKPEVSA